MNWRRNLRPSLGSAAIDAAFVFGALTIVAGVAMFSVPAGVIVAGAMLMALAFIVPSNERGRR